MKRWIALLFFLGMISQIAMAKHHWYQGQSTRDDVIMGAVLFANAVAYWIAYRRETRTI